MPRRTHDTLCVERACCKLIYQSISFLFFYHKLILYTLGARRNHSVFPVRRDKNKNYECSHDPTETSSPDRPAYGRDGRICFTFQRLGTGLC